MAYICATFSKISKNEILFQDSDPGSIGNGKCDYHFEENGLCIYDGGDCCDQSDIGNGRCENHNNFACCGNYDGGDCKDQNEKLPLKDILSRLNLNLDQGICTKYPMF